MRRGVARFSKDYEVAIKKKNDTILENHFVRQTSKRRSEYKIVAITAEVTLMSISFTQL